MNDVETLFQYLAVRDRIQQADLILGFGVYDRRVPAHCAELYHAGYAPLILFSGGYGSGSGPLDEPEALFFEKQARDAGVPASAILTETYSTNTLENVLFSKNLLEKTGRVVGSIILVAQPHRQRRVWRTSMRWMAGIAFVNYPPHSCVDEEITRFGGIDAFTRSLLDEMKRIEAYGVKGDLSPEKGSDHVQRILKSLDGSR